LIVMRNPIEELVGTDSTTVAQLLHARASSSPDRPFLRWEQRTWTYAEAWEEILRFSGWALDATPRGDGAPRIASFLPNGPEAVWTWLGALVSGHVYVPLNRVHRGELLQAMLDRSRADVLVTDREGLQYFAHPNGHRGRTVLVVDRDWAAVDASAPACGPPQRPDDLAELMYTSGTTGRSKAVRLSHNQLCRGAGWLAWSLDMTPDDVIHAWLPLFHIAGQLDTVLALTVAGGRVALYPTFSRSRFWDQVDESRATIFIGFSNVLEILWKMPASSRDAECTLRAGIMGGIPSEIHRDFERRFGVRLHDAYGMTEAEPLVLPHPGRRYPVGAIGHANPDLELTILGDDDVPCPPGEIGEIAARPRIADVITAGYEGDEDATADAFRNGWFHTGDLGRMDPDGVVSFVDRKKHAIRRRGENISSWELENLISKHPAVGEVCAIAVPSPLGEDDIKVVIAAREGTALDPAELHAWCQDRMARFMIPRYIEIRPALPRGPTGKVAKHELASTGVHVWDADGEPTGAAKPHTR
jgi:carnitine-CoA ligase